MAEKEGENGGGGCGRRGRSKWLKGKREKREVGGGGGCRVDAATVRLKP